MKARLEKTRESYRPCKPDIADQAICRLPLFE
jgi:hypothetical protein